jgi:signal transduction histidine kinase
MGRSLKVKFLAYISTLIICAMGIATGASYINSKEVVRKAIMQQLSQMVVSTSDYIAFWIHDRKQDLVNWSGQQSYQTSLEDSYLGRAARQSASLRLREQKQNYGYYESINLANVLGEVLSSSDEKILGKNVGRQQFFQETLKGNVFLSSVMKSPDTGKPVFVISVPVRKSGMVEGVFYGVVDVNNFNDLFVNSIKIGKTGYVYIFDSEGVTIAHPEKRNILDLNVSVYDWGREMLQRKQGFINYTWKGVAKTAFFQQHKELGWFVGAGAGLDEIFAPVRRLQLINLWITIIFIIVAVFSVNALYGRIILRPMSYLMDGIARFGRGGLDQKIDLKTGDEFDKLAGAFNKMIADLQKVTVSRDELVQEVTERKRVEEELHKAYQQLKTTEAQLVQSAKMASVGTLAGGVAHEINNPLAGVLNNVQLIKMMAQEKKDFNMTDFKELLAVIEESAVRCKNITQSLLDFSRASKGVFQPLSLNDIAEKTIVFVENELRIQNIEIRKDIQADLPLVSGDFQLLQQVVIDIISNAKWAIQKKSVNGGGSIILKTRHDPEKKNISMSISDSGVGISQENIGKIFEPFFTTKPVGEGTGLGLSIVYGIIKAHHGTINVESGVGQGTTFIISLPVAVG